MNQPDNNSKTANWLRQGPSVQDAEATETPELPERVGRYRIERVLGRGGYGTVYLALDEQLHRRVAVKIPHPRRVRAPAELEAGLNEARMLAKFDHPHILPVYDVGQTEDGCAYIVSKYVEGNSLAIRLRQMRLDAIEAAALTAAVAEALQHAHRRNIVHRDVKPGNILLDSDGHIYLADFGLALQEEDFGKTSGYAGTPSYMSPEQARGEGHLLDGRSDVFSLGVVFYKCLTGIRPFRGQTVEEVIDRILHLEAKPPRQVCDGIPRELERICLRALAKRASERYTTAGDMAEDLQHFLKAADTAPLARAGALVGGAALREPEQRHEEAAADSRRSSDALAIQCVVPKGLRSFDQRDAEFFLSLLPGPRDHRGVPESIRFWKARVEATSPEDTFRVGVLYGPSGCGKSSLVKAGLLPQLDDSCVTSAYIETAAHDTELRLLRRLRNDFSQLPQHESLPQTLRELRRTPAASGGKKVLIVLDQFEQWLQGRSQGERDELLMALRQCDGTRLSCLLLVRDDFWLALSRLMADLDADMAAGRNVALVDLFDLSHARQVLAAFGRAFETLPADPRQMTGGQRRFLEQAVASLAEGDKVICVRLTLLAEMMKGRRWEPSVLHELGGAEGLGARFLEETFVAPTADPRYRQHSVAARAVLKALLPPQGTNIKGHLWSRDELLAVSGYGKHQAQFAELPQILDRELRLVTPSDGDARQAPPNEQGAARGAEFYQLTHDYLVPSLREWLGRKQRETCRGRAEIRLDERAQFWSVRPEAKQLPSFGEWLRMCALTQRRTWTETQTRMMQAARRHHLLRVLLVAVVLGVLSGVGWSLYQWQHARSLVARLLEADTSGVPEIVAEMASCRPWVNPLLAAAAGTEDSKKRLHVSLARLPQDHGQLAVLKDFLLAGRPAEIRVIRDALRPSAAHLTPEFWRLLDDSAEPSGRRFRAASALGDFDSSDPRWAEHAESVAAWLVAENMQVVPEWADLFRPLQRNLTAPLKRLFTAERPDWRSAAAVVLADYLGDDVAQLVQLNRHSNDTQRAILVDRLREQPGRAIEQLQRELSRTVAADALQRERELLARQQASAGLALMLLDESAVIWPLLGQLEDPQLRTCLIHGFASAGVDPGPLLAGWRTQQDSTLRVALLLSLGEYRDSLLLSRRQRDALTLSLLAAFRTDPHPGIHSAAEWLLRELGQAERIREVEQELQGQAPPPLQDWFVTPQGQTLILIRGPVDFLMGSPDREEGREKGETLRRETIPRSYAIATKEVTLAQFRRFWPDFRSTLQGDNHLNLPVDRVDLFTAMSYCNWLSDVEGLPSEQRCYVDRGDGRLRLAPDGLQRTGYRLPSEREWEYACRAGTATPRYDGFGVDYLDCVSWNKRTADRPLLAVGSLIPNGWGLFDVYGNVREWCHPASPLADGSPLPENDDFACVRGGSTSSDTRTLRSAYRLDVLASSALGEYGFRIARTHAGFDCAVIEGVRQAGREIGQRE